MNGPQNISSQGSPSSLESRSDQSGLQSPNHPLSPGLLSGFPHFSFVQVKSACESAACQGPFSLPPSQELLALPSCSEIKISYPWPRSLLDECCLKALSVYTVVRGHKEDSPSPVPDFHGPTAVCLFSHRLFEVGEGPSPCVWQVAHAAFGRDRIAVAIELQIKHLHL